MVNEGESNTAHHFTIQGEDEEEEEEEEEREKNEGGK